MTRGLIYSTRGVTASIHESLIQQMKIVETQSSTIDFLSTYKSRKPLDYIENKSGIKITDHLTSLRDFYYSHAINMESWNEIYEKLDVNFLSDYDDLYVFGGIFSTASALKRYEKRNHIFPNDRGQIKFESVALPCLHELALLKANKEFGTRLHEICFDPLEMSIDLFHPDFSPKTNYTLYHGYDVAKLNMKRLDSLQYFYQNEKKSFIESQYDKDIDFTFGMTIFQDFRKKYYDDVRDIQKQFEKTNLYVLNKITGENTFLDRQDYLKQIARSKFTMILPAYDSNCFSIYRLLESLNNDCLPLIHEDCYIEEINKSYNTDLGVLMTRVPFSERDRMDLLNIFKNIFLKVERKFVV